MGATDVFADALERVGVTLSRTSAATFGATITDAVDPPAVGVPLTGTPVSLAETPVSLDPTPAELRRATTGVTPASLAVADYGSVALPCRSDGAELVSLFVDRHVVVLDESAVTPDMETAFERFAESPSDSESQSGPESRILATGPSATADMGALVQGAHGPKDVTAILVED
jgi:L-lactate dehydrogenase complex protein LldG